MAGQPLENWISNDVGGPRLAVASPERTFTSTGAHCSANRTVLGSMFAVALDTIFLALIRQLQAERF